MKEINFTCVERFLKYVQIDTQSDPESNTCPSTDKQKDLGKILVEELKQIGVKDAHMDENGYVYGTVESNSVKKVPVICFCSHMDTSPETSGANVKPVLHKNYQGGDIVLQGDTAQVLKPSEHTHLKSVIGNDIITSDGTTLLGADDKAGVAEIMDAVNHFITYPEIKHGAIKILFTPDEEIGRGVDKADLKKLAADFAYTMDGGALGLVEDETFSADSAVITIHGVITHPGRAKDKMENAVKIASDIMAALPKDSLSPETTEERQGFIHPVSINGGVETTVIKLIIRDYEDSGLVEKEAYLEDIIKKVLTHYPNSGYEYKTEESYRNMKKILNSYPHVTQYAFEAVRRTGAEPKSELVRGGTDGSRLSYMGLPCPNIFSGGEAIHSKKEWVSVQTMQKAVETIIHLAMIWEEKSK